MTENILKALIRLNDYGAGLYVQIRYLDCSIQAGIANIIMCFEHE